MIADLTDMQPGNQPFFDTGEMLNLRIISLLGHAVNDPIYTMNNTQPTWGYLTVSFRPVACPVAGTIKIAIARLVTPASVFFLAYRISSDTYQVTFQLTNFKLVIQSTISVKENGANSTWRNVTKVSRVRFDFLSSILAILGFVAISSAEFSDWCFVLPHERANLFDTRRCAAIHSR